MSVYDELNKKGDAVTATQNRTKTPMSVVIEEPSAAKTTTGGGQLSDGESGSAKQPQVVGKQPQQVKPILASELGDAKYKTPVDAYKEYLSELEKEKRNANSQEEIKKKRQKTIASAVIDGIGALGNVIATANGATSAAPSTFSARANAKNKEDEEKYQKRRDAISSAKIALGKAREESMYKGLEEARKARTAALSDWYTQMRGNATMLEMARDEEMHELNKLLTDNKITQAAYDAEVARIKAKYAEREETAKIGSLNRSNRKEPKQTYSFLGKTYDSLHDLQRDVYAYANEDEDIETEDKNLFEVIAQIEKKDKNSN